MTEAILSVEDLWKSYPREAARRWPWSKPVGPRAFHAVAGVSFELWPGQCLGVVGESGSGKSTLVRMLAGLLAPSSGRILLRGEPARLQQPEQRRKLQMVFQDPTESLNPSFSVHDTICEPLLRLRGFRRGAALEARCAELADLVQLPRALLSRYPHQLSGGQRARVGIARALAPEPEVLLLDEPTTALDVSVQARILLLLADLRAQLGTSFVFVTHDLGVVRLLCDSVVVMKDGRIVEDGPTARVMSEPAHSYTRALVEALPQLSPPAASPVAAGSGAPPAPGAPVDAVA